MLLTLTSHLQKLLPDYGPYIPQVGTTHEGLFIYHVGLAIPTKVGLIVVCVFLTIYNQNSLISREYISALDNVTDPGRLLSVKSYICIKTHTFVT